MQNNKPKTSNSLKKGLKFFKKGNSNQVGEKQPVDPRKYAETNKFITDNMDKLIPVIYTAPDGYTITTTAQFFQLTAKTMFAKKNGSIVLGNQSPVDLSKFTFTFHGAFSLKGPEGITLEGTFNSGKVQSTMIYSCPIKPNLNFVSSAKNGILDQPENGFKQIEKTKGVYVIEFNDGRMYQGQCLYILPHGKGVMQYPSGEGYHGMFYLGMQHGKGEFKNKKIGYHYKGDFKFGKATGKGTLTQIIGKSAKTGKILQEVYQGTFINGVKNGVGRLTNSDGSIYEGEFSHGKQNGTGKFTFPNGSYYQGEFIQGKANGSGLIKDKDGNLYKGHVKDGKKHGIGQFQLTEGSVYYGSFINGQANGKGKLVDKMGNTYAGEFQNGQKHGQGVLIYKNGDKYSGVFKDGKKNGMGTYTWKTGQSETGYWENNEFKHKAIAEEDESEGEVAAPKKSRKDSKSSKAKKI